MKTATQIAKDLGCTRQWVHRIAERLGIVPEKIGNFVGVFSPEQVKQIEKLIPIKKTK